MFHCQMGALESKGRIFCLLHLPWLQLCLRFSHNMPSWNLVNRLWGSFTQSTSFTFLSCFLIEISTLNQRISLFMISLIVFLMATFISSYIFVSIKCWYLDYRMYLTGLCYISIYWSLFCWRSGFLWNLSTSKYVIMLISSYW